MSYDGGLEIKIKNKKLGEVLEEFAGRGYFQEEFVQRCMNRPAENEWGEPIRPNVKYTFFYSYMDSAYVNSCPKDINDVGNCLLELICVFEENLNYNQQQEIKDRINQEDVIRNYKLVEWNYYLPDSMEVEEFSYKK